MKKFNLNVTGNQSPNTVGTKLFDLHFEIGINPPPLGGFYALTILGSNGIKFEEMGASPADCLARISAAMEVSGMWQSIANDPRISAYPFGNTATGKSANISNQSQNAYDPSAPKQRPADLTRVSHPDCQNMCQSFEHFGNSRCKSICAQRSGL